MLCCALAALTSFAASAEPAAPGGLRAAPGDEEVALTWRNPDNPAIVGYQFRLSSTEGETLAFETWTDVPNGDAQTVQHTVVGLANGIQYVFQLRAADEDGPGKPAWAFTTLAASPLSPVEVRDAPLRTRIRAQLGLADGSPVTQGDLARLTELEVRNAYVVDLTGLEFAINLRSLDLNYNRIADVSALSGLTTLRNLSLSGNSIADISALFGLKLWQLELRDNRIVDVSALSSLTTLEYLQLSDNRIADVSPLSGLIILEYLYLHDNEVVDVSPLSSLTALSSLGLSDNAIADVSPLSPLTMLEYLDMGGNEIVDVSPLSSLTKLRSLLLGDNAITDVSALSGLTWLEELDLGNEVTSRIDLGNDVVDVSPLSGLTRLRHLRLSVKTTDLSLTDLPALTHLHLAGSVVSQVSLSHLTSLRQLGIESTMTNLSLADLPSLSTLTLRFASVTGRISLSRIPLLRAFRMRFNTTTDLSLIDLPSLTRIDLLGRVEGRIWLSGLTSLTYLDLAHSVLEDLSLSDMPSLESLVLSGCDLDDVSILSDLTSLTTLILRDNSITDISALSGLTSLEQLDLSSNTIEDISPLAQLASLTTLYLEDNSIADISALSGLTSLTALVLSSNEITDLSALSGLASLAALHLADNAIQDISALSGLASLQHLYLSNNGIVDVSALSGLTLRSLFLGDNEMASFSLADLPSLEALQIGTVSGQVSLSGLPSLWLLDLSGQVTGLSLTDLPSLTDFDFAATLSGRVSLSRLTALTELDLSDQAITTLSVADMPWLYELHLARNRIAKVTLSGVPSLSKLDLRGNVLTDVSALSSVYSLGWLDLSGNAIGDISALSGLTSLVSLYLSGNEIADVSALSGLTSLWGLYLSGNKIADLSPLSGLVSLVWLELSGNEITDVSALSGLEALVWLYLSANGVSDVSALSGLLSLQVLDLSGNKVADISALSSLTELGGLHLPANEVVDLSALSGLTALGVLDLSGNAIADVSALSELRGLWALDLSGNEIMDVSGLSRLDLSYLFLYDNHIADISRLYDGLGSVVQQYLDLRGNPLGSSQAVHVQALREWDVAVVYDDGIHRVPLFPATGSSTPGFVRVINHSEAAGSVSIEAVDETGERRPPVSLAIDSGQALHFDAWDLEQGNAHKGLLGVGATVGDWRLLLRSELDIEVLGYARRPGFITSLHDLAPKAGRTSWVPMFNPASNERQVSRLRLENQNNWNSLAVVTATDDTGRASRSEIPNRPRQIQDWTAAQLESGVQGSVGGVGIGDGAGNWRLNVRVAGQLMSLLQEPGGVLANISTGTAATPWHWASYYSWERGGRYRVPLFPAASSDPKGVLRIVNLSQGHAAVTLRAFDETGAVREPVMLMVRPGGALHLNSDDLEQGNAAIGLSGVGRGTGDWHMEVSADRRFEVLTYAQTSDGFITSLHDIAPLAKDGSLWIPFFDPGSGSGHVSRLRLVNWGETATEVTIEGIDDAGESSRGVARVTMPARSARDYLSGELETGTGPGLSGALGEGIGRWRLSVYSAGDIEAMSLMNQATSHLTNLSTTPRHPPEGSARGSSHSDMNHGHVAGQADF